MIGRAGEMLFPPDRHDDRRDRCRRVLGGERFERIATRIQRYDGMLVPVALTMIPLPDREGICVIARDSLSSCCLSRHSPRASLAGYLRIVPEVKTEAGLLTLSVPPFLMDAIALHLAQHRNGDRPRRPRVPRAEGRDPPPALRRTGPRSRCQAGWAPGEHDLPRSAPHGGHRHGRLRGHVQHHSGARRPRHRPHHDGGVLPSHHRRRRRRGGRPPGPLRAILFRPEWPRCGPKPLLDADGGA